MLDRTQKKGRKPTLSACPTLCETSHTVVRVKEEVESIRRNTGPRFKLQLVIFKEQKRGLSTMVLLKMDFREADLITVVQTWI